MKKCITTVYYLIANFCKIDQEWEDKKLLLCNSKRHRQGSLDLCELLTKGEIMAVKITKGNRSNISFYL